MVVLLNFYETYIPSDKSGEMGSRLQCCRPLIENTTLTCFFGVLDCFHLKHCLIH